MEDSILKSIKKLLGIEEDDMSFDTDIIIHINSAFSRLRRLGVGPEKSFSIRDDYPVWNDFIQDNDNIEDVKTYIYLKVKLLFDPPANSSVLSSMKETINQLEWELNVEAETPIINTEGE